MRGFFPFTTLRVRMTNKNRMANKTSNGKSKSKMRGSLHFGRDDDLFVRGLRLG